MLLTEIRKKRIIIPIPFSMGKIQAFFLQMFPKPLLTLDQVQILQEGDNIVSDQIKHLKILRLNPKILKILFQAT